MTAMISSRESTSQNTVRPELNPLAHRIMTPALICGNHLLDTNVMFGDNRIYCLRLRTTGHNDGLSPFISPLIAQR